MLECTYAYKNVDDTLRGAEFRAIKGGQDNCLHEQILYVLYYNYSKDPKEGWVNLTYTNDIYPDEDKFNSELMNLKKKDSACVYRAKNGVLLAINAGKITYSKSFDIVRVRMTENGVREYERKMPLVEVNVPKIFLKFTDPDKNFPEEEESPLVLRRGLFLSCIAG